jgi:hypothetical protein
VEYKDWDNLMFVFRELIKQLSRITNALNQYDREKPFSNLDLTEFDLTHEPTQSLISQLQSSPVYSEERFSVLIKDLLVIIRADRCYLRVLDYLQNEDLVTKDSRSQMDEIKKLLTRFGVCSTESDKHIVLSDDLYSEIDQLLESEKKMTANDWQTVMAICSKIEECGYPRFLMSKLHRLLIKYTLG